MKVCAKCRETKPLEAFGPNKHMKCGRQSWCRACAAAARRKPDAKPRPTPEQVQANLRARQKRYHEKHREERIAASARRFAINRESDNVRRRQDYWANPEAGRKASREYYVGNKAERLAYAKSWVGANRGKKNAQNAKRKRHIARATPPWADLCAIATVYQVAEEYKALGLDVHVDHIIPLQGETVSGLHVPENLRVILASDNISKHNKLLPDAAPTALHELA